MGNRNRIMRAVGGSKAGEAVLRAERNEFYLNKGSILTFSSRAAVDSPLYLCLRLL